MRRRASFLPFLFYLSTLAYFLFGYSTLTLGNDWAAKLYPEDHFFENVGAISLFTASLACLLAAARAGRNQATRSKLAAWIILVLALIFFIGAGQEISWGQRILHRPDPAAALQPAALTQADQGNAAPPRFDKIFGYLVLAAAVLLPVAYLALPAFRQLAARFIDSPFWAGATLFPFNYLFAAFARESMKPFYRYKLFRFPQAVQAVKESNYEFAALLLALTLLWQVRQTIKRRPSETSSLPPRKSLD